jgi:hypothetical protein
MHDELELVCDILDFLWKLKIIEASPEAVGIGPVELFVAKMLPLYEDR